MLASTKAVIEACHDAGEHDRMNFPQILMALADVGIESYSVDFRRSTKTYYHANGDSLALAFAPEAVPVAPVFDIAVVQEAIREAQTQAPGYRYRGFCRKVMAAGCAGYITSLLGRRVVYYGRTGEIHVELFPEA